MTATSPFAVAAADPSAIIDFAMPGLFDWLERASAGDLDGLAFGLVALAAGGIVEHYNLAEANLSGLTPARVVGRDFFTSVAPCANNFMVAERFATEPTIDAVVDYIFTFRLAPMKVRLRLMRRQGGRRSYLAVQRRD
jgi:photoactive yellow protein